MITRRTAIIGAAAVALLAACDDKKAGVPSTPAASGWQFFNSPTMRTVQLDSNGYPHFDFPVLPGSVHMLMKQTGPINGTLRVRYRLEGGPLSPVQGQTATISAMFQRAGDNWSGSGQYESYRWYHAGDALTAGEHSLQVPLVEGHWRNVMGRSDPAGFEAAKANAALIGLAFGDPSAGATAHGVHGNGRFTVLEFSVQ